MRKAFLNRLREHDESHCEERTEDQEEDDVEDEYNLANHIQSRESVRCLREQQSNSSCRHRAGEPGKREMVNSISY